MELEIRVGRGTEKNKDVGLDKHIHATTATSITTAASANTITDADDIAAAAKDNTVTHEQQLVLLQIPLQLDNAKKILLSWGSIWGTTLIILK